MPFRESRLAWFSKEVPKNYKDAWLNFFGKITTNKKAAAWYFTNDVGKFDRNTAKYFDENDVLLYHPQLIEEFVALDKDINDDFKFVSYAKVVEPHVIVYSGNIDSEEELGEDPYNKQLWESDQHVNRDDEEIQSSVRTQETVDVVNDFMHVREGDSHTFALCDVEVFDPRNTGTWKVQY